MHANAELIERFYRAFQQRDGQTMADCYHPDAKFSDPGFPDLRGPQVGAMWRMLTERAKDFSLDFSNVTADAEHGSVNWTARYIFSANGRKVVNHVRSEFRFKDGRIIDQSDYFPFYPWARQALGPIGWLLGWSGMLRRKVQATAMGQLHRYMEKRA
jgi:ketosteroid isomerase-like protein